MRLLSGLNEIACLIPDSFYEVCEMIKPLIPEEGMEKKLKNKYFTKKIFFNNGYLSSLLTYF